MSNGNQSAFGYGFCTANGDNHSDSPGLTKREYFAGLAMQGIMSQSHLNQNRKADWSKDMGHGWGEDCCNSLNCHNVSTAMSIAAFSVQVADTLLKELETPNNKPNDG